MGKYELEAINTQQRYSIDFEEVPCEKMIMVNQELEVELNCQELEMRN